MSLAGLAFIIAGVLLVVLAFLVFGLACFTAGNMPKNPTEDDYNQAAIKLVTVFKRKRVYGILTGLFIGSVLVGLFGLIVGA